MIIFYDIIFIQICKFEKKSLHGFPRKKTSVYSNSAWNQLCQFTRIQD